jgi:GABA permease
VGHRDPIHAVEAVLQERQFDEIVVSTLPKRISRWLGQDLPRRLEHKTQLPVTHIGATK